MTWQVAQRRPARLAWPIRRLRSGWGRSPPLAAALLQPSPTPSSAVFVVLSLPEVLAPSDTAKGGNTPSFLHRRGQWDRAYLGSGTVAHLAAESVSYLPEQTAINNSYPGTGWGVSGRLLTRRTVTAHRAAVPDDLPGRPPGGLDSAQRPLVGRCASCCSCGPVCQPPCNVSVLPPLYPCPVGPRNDHR